MKGRKGVNQRRDHTTLFNYEGDFLTSITVKSAPFSIKISTISFCPVMDAECSGVSHNQNMSIIKAETIYGVCTIWEKFKYKIKHKNRKIQSELPVSTLKMWKPTNVHQTSFWYGKALSDQKWSRYLIKAISFWIPNRHTLTARVSAPFWMRNWTDFFFPFHAAKCIGVCKESQMTTTPFTKDQPTILPPMEQSPEKRWGNSSDRVSCYYLYFLSKGIMSKSQKPKEKAESGKNEIKLTLCCEIPV